MCVHLLKGVVYHSHFRDSANKRNRKVREGKRSEKDRGMEGWSQIQEVDKIQSSILLEMYKISGSRISRHYVQVRGGVFESQPISPYITEIRVQIVRIMRKLFHKADMINCLKPLFYWRNILLFLVSWDKIIWPHPIHVGWLNVYIGLLVYLYNEIRLTMGHFGIA